MFKCTYIRLHTHTRRAKSVAALGIELSKTERERSEQILRAPPNLRTTPSKVRLAPAASTSLEGTGVVQPLHTSRKAKKQLKPDTAGAAWGHMTAKELTPELKRDLQIIRMRGVLDPKRFYRSSDMKKELPKYFQVGTLIGGAEDAGAKKKPRGTMLQDVMGDAKIRKRTKEQFGKIQAVKALSARPRKGERGAARSSKGKKKKR